MDSNVKIRKEAPVYPTMSFISELGGSFGLFVGFSFLSVFDIYHYLFRKLYSIKYHLEKYQKQKETKKINNIKT